MRRVLVITYNWPPAGGVGVLRCLKFVKYLRDFGWEPVVFTAKNANYPTLDHTNFKDVPEGIEIHRVSSWEPFKLFRWLSGRKSGELANPIIIRDRPSNIVDKLSIWIRGNLFVPDARALWIRPSVRYLLRYLKQHPVDAILSDGPPHTNTRIACLVCKKMGIPWLADFQDPWTQVDYFPDLKLTGWGYKRHSKMEQEVFQVASKITIASPTWKHDLESIGAKNVDPIYYGFDHDDYKGIEQSTRHDQFRLVHAGMLGYDRCPDVLFEALSGLLVELPGFEEKLQIILPGFVDYKVQESIREHGLSSFLILPGSISRENSLREMVNADLLLLPLNKASNVNGRIPGKLFEYLRAEKPILCLGPAGTDVAKIIADTRSGANFAYSDKEGMKNYIKSCFLGELRSFAPVKELINTYSNFEQTHRVASYLNEICRDRR